jgi:ADP-ribose pyrophosphatase YjhB (NUDIX family)
MMPNIRYYAIKTFWFFVHPVQIAYWFVFRPNVRGVKCLIRNSHGDILLVRLNYSHRRWVLPGGGVRHGETYKDAAYRELKEETGITKVMLDRIGSYESTFEYKRVAVEAYKGVALTQEVTIDPIEIAEYGWFKEDALPYDIAPSVTRILGMDEKFAEVT